MKISEIVNEKYDLAINDLENMFNVYKDADENYFFNLNSTMYIDYDSSVIKTFICDYDMPWPIISYKIYKTTRLTWLLFKINKVKMENTLKPMPAASIIYYIEIDNFNEILNQL